MQAARVDAAHAARDDGDLRGGAQDERVQLLAGLGVVLLGVVERAQRADVAHAERARSRTAPRRRRAGRRGSRGRPRRRRRRSGRPSPRSNWKSRRPVRASRAGACEPGGSSEEADAVGGPVGGEGSADDPLRGTGPQNRLSSDSPRLSPIMNQCPGGIVIGVGKLHPRFALFAHVFEMNGSFSRLPLRITWPSTIGSCRPGRRRRA